MTKTLNQKQHNSFEYVDHYSTNYHNCQHLNREFRPQPHSSPHAAGEYCSDCGKWLRWVGKKEYSIFNQNTGNSRLNGGAV